MYIRESEHKHMDTHRHTQENECVSEYTLITAVISRLHKMSANRMYRNREKSWEKVKWDARKEGVNHTKEPVYPSEVTLP